MSLYNDTSRTLTIQVTGIITKQSSRSPVFRQSANTLLAPTEKFSDQNFAVKAGSVHHVGQINHAIFLSINTKIQVVIVRNSEEQIFDVKQVFCMMGKIDGEVYLRNTSSIDEPVHLIFA